MRLTVVKSEWLDDWWIIERAEHSNTEWFEPITYGGSARGFAFRCSGRFSDADVEGYSNEMHAIADAIECRGRFSARRCAVDATGTDVRFRSPRNSSQDGVVSLVEADALVVVIRALVPRAPTPQGEGKPP